ncbi:Mov34/MPN/PAD-1 family protein [Aeromonas veronii]
MSFSHTQSLSCLLADQIRFAIEQSGAQIKIWRNDFDSGSRTSISIEAKKPLRNKFHTNNTLDVIWDEGIEEKVKHLRSQALPNETGGILVGYYDFVYKKVMIVDALPPPSDSISTPSSFVRGENGVAESLAYINKQTRDVVKYIGEWHSHPKGCSASMSTQDKTQLKQLSERQSIIGYPAYQMIVAENEIKVYEQLAD